MRKLNLIATDIEDLAIISAAIQDAIVNIGGIHFDKSTRALTLRMSRFSHEAKDKIQRVEAGLRIDGVLGLQSQGINRENPESFAVILDLAFEALNELSGYLNIQLAGGGILRAEVEALDIILADTDNMRATKIKPSHDL